MKVIVVLCVFGVIAASAAPAGDDASATVVRESFDLNPDDGSYKYNYETSNGIKADQSGKQITVGTEQGASATGSLSYTAPDGTVISLTYNADENGFAPQGSHLPTPPPVPEHVVKLLADLAKAQKA